MKTYSFFDKIILRTPLKEIEINITWEKIQNTFQKTLFKEALFVASPSLLQLLENYTKDPKSFPLENLQSLKNSLYKYYARFSNRCTPFGLFAMVSTLKLENNTDIDITTSSIRKATRFDAFFLANLLQFIDKIPEIRQHLTYYLNSSLYSASDKYRYVEYYFKEEVRYHKISGVDKSIYLERVLDTVQKGAKLFQLSDCLTGGQVNQSQAIGFIHTLINNQFLVSELELTLSGKDYLEQLIAILSQPRFSSYEAETTLSLLKELQSRLKNIEKDTTASVTDYLQLFEYIQHHFDEVPVKKMFQVDTFRAIEQGTLDTAICKQLRTAVQVINKLSFAQKNEVLEHFKTRFTERYEEYEMPLVQVLDPDIGIGYARSINAKIPLVEGLSLVGEKPKSRKIDWDSKQSMLFRKLLNCYPTGESEIKLQESDLKDFQENEKAYYDTFSIFFNVFKEGGADKIHIKGLWGPSAANLTGRFAHLDESIYALNDEIGEKEAGIYKDKIVAEIIHLPQARVANVLHRKNTRAYEIPYLAKSSLPLAQQLSINDLMISVKNGKVILRSKSLNKEIIPRLSNAHNYSANALPIYHFLCDLQMQGSQPLGFSFGPLRYEYPFIPRVSYKNIVLSRATWLLQKEEMEILYKNKTSDTFLKEFLRKRKIPTIIVISEGDNEVLINFDNELSRAVFYNVIKKKKFFEIKEFLFQEGSVTGNYANEFIASVYKNVAVEKHPKLPVKQITNEATKKTFSIGDDWLYYKFYCGDKVAEKVLQEALLPTIIDLKNKQLIKKWFFIRYMDKDGFHIRFRIKIQNKDSFSSCINSIKYHIAPFEKDGIIWKTQVDTYLRETERYGYHSIEASEQFFHVDSECTLQFINMIEGEAGEEIRWLFSLLSMEKLLNDFGYSLKDKIAIMNLLKTGFGKEFNRKGALNKQINELYKQNAVQIESFLSVDQKSPIYQPLWDILAIRSSQMKNIVTELKQLEEAKKLPMPLALGIIPSYLHMICNRVFLSKQRVHEMVVYDFLFKFYNKKLHTQGKVAIKK